MKQVSIVIPVYNQLKMTVECLNDVLRTSGVEIEVIVVDDGSREPVSRAIKKIFPQIKVLTNESNMGFARSVNKGIMDATHNLICLLNNDIRLPNSAWLKKMVKTLDSGVDITSPAFGRLNHKWDYIPGEIKRSEDLSDKEFQYPVGWALLVKASVFEKIGLLDTSFGHGYFEDVLFAYRAKKAGFKMDITENTKIEHLYHKTFISEGYDLTKEYQEKRKIFLDILNRRE